LFIAQSLILCTFKGHAFARASLIRPELRQSFPGIATGNRQTATAKTLERSTATAKAKPRQTEQTKRQTDRKIKPNKHA